MEKSTKEKRESSLKATRNDPVKIFTRPTLARLSSVRIAMALTARHALHIRQLDVTTAYLNGAVDEEIYIKIPPYTEEVL